MKKTIKRPNVVETATSNGGTEYRLIDDGNHIIGHIFTIEKKKVFPEGVAWFPTNGRHYCEWKKASDVMKAMLAA